MTETTTAPKLKPALHDYQRRFAEARAKARFSSLRIAEAIGKSPQSVLQFEQGKQGFDIPTFVAACDVMRLRVEWVLKGIGEMFDGEMPDGGSQLERKKRQLPAAGKRLAERS